MLAPHDNPFAVFSPEGLPAKEVLDLFVRDVPGVSSIQSDGHTLLVGARGCGKSMILRFMEPDCQALEASTRADKKAEGLSAIPYFAAYLTIKQTDLNYPELSKLEGSLADHLVNEHFLVITVALKVITRVLDNRVFKGNDATIGQDVATEFTRLQLRTLDTETDIPKEQLISTEDTIHAALKKWRHFLTDAFDETLRYLHSLVDQRDIPPFPTPLLRFSNFLLPFFDLWRRFPGMPKSRRFFLLIDDADKLTDTQTRILNTWLSQRAAHISIKVSAELYEYATFYTLGKTRIESPHDFQEINLSDVYTSNKADYYRARIHQIVNRRLARTLANDPDFADADKFFPEDSRQSVAIKKLIEEIRQSWEHGVGRSKRARDDAYRYGRPEYMRRLGGERKSRSKYSYSGFMQLVNISSGIPRFFLEAAHKMFDREVSQIAAGRRQSGQISPPIQDTVVRQQAEDLYMKELEKLKLDQMKSKDTPATALKLHNLIGCLGGLFEAILLDKELSERRVFSFAISDYASESVAAVLRLGVKHAYFSRTTIGRKEGFGRTERYILTRRLAPLFNLDPNGFSAYKFLTNSELTEMMESPDQYRRRLRRGDILGDSPAQQMELEFLREDDE